MSAIDELETQVAQNASVEASAVQVIQGIADEIKAAISGHDSADIARLEVLQKRLQDSAGALANAIAANTPGASSPAPGVSSASSVNPAGGVNPQAGGGKVNEGGTVTVSSSGGDVGGIGTGAATPGVVGGAPGTPQTPTLNETTGGVAGAPDGRLDQPGPDAPPVMGRKAR